MENETEIFNINFFKKLFIIKLIKEIGNTRLNYKSRIYTLI